LIWQKKSTKIVQANLILAKTLNIESRQRQEKNLIKLFEEVKHFHKMPTWLPHDCNNAILACIGAGPWNQQRRNTTQESILLWFNKQNVSDISLLTKIEKIYPLIWQNELLFNLNKNLKSLNTTFRQRCYRYLNEKYFFKDPVEDFFNLFGEVKEAHILWTFVRDYLNLPAFPINKLVKKELKANELPDDSLKIIEICLKTKIDPNFLSRCLANKCSANLNMVEKDGSELHSNIS